MTHAGALRSKNVGTSNHNRGEIPLRRKIKVSLAMKISQGLVGPKGMARAVLDGQKVNIPLPVYSAMEGRSSVCIAHYWICVSYIRNHIRKIRYVLKANSKYRR